MYDMDVIKVCELIASELFDIVNDEAKYLVLGIYEEEIGCLRKYRKRQYYEMEK